MSEKSSWVKNEKMIQNEEHIIVPNEDVFDLKNFSVNKDSETIQEKAITSNQEQIAPKVSINPEDLRSKSDPRYFYESTSNNHKEKSSHNWFLVTFLMTLVILGSLYFYFVIEDKNSKISGLERQILNKNEPKVKGVREILGVNQSNPITITPNSANSKNFSISTTGNNFSLKTSEVSVSINYFNSQIGTKTTFTKDDNKDGKINSIEIFWAEKQDSLNKDQIVKNVLKLNPDFEVDSKIFNSANSLEFTLLKPKEATNRNKIYVGTSASFMYVVGSSNESFGQANDSNINSFIDNIISKISFN